MPPTYAILSSHSFLHLPFGRGLGCPLGVHGEDVRIHALGRGLGGRSPRCVYIAGLTAGSCSLSSVQPGWPAANGSHTSGMRDSASLLIGRRRGEVLMRSPSLRHPGRGVRSSRRNRHHELRCTRVSRVAVTAPRPMSGRGATRSPCPTTTAGRSLSRYGSCGAMAAATL